MRGLLGIAVAATVAASASPALAQDPGIAAPPGAPADYGADGTGAVFVDVFFGVVHPVSDEAYDALIDTSFEIAASGGYLFAIGGGEAWIGPEVLFGYTVEDVDDEFEDGTHLDISAGRLRLIGAGRFQVDLGGPFVFARLGVGLDYQHVAWQGRFAGTWVEEDDDDTGLGLLAGLGFGFRVIELLAIVVAFNVPMSIHGSVSYGDIDYWRSVETAALETTLGATFFF